MPKHIKLSANKLFRTFIVSTLLGSGLVLGSAAVSVADTQAVPSAPTNVTVPAKTQSSVSLSWTAASDNGSAVTDYRIEFSDDGTNWTVFNDGVSASTNATVTGLARGGGYVFRVSAINANGAGLSGLALGAKMMTSSSSAGHFCVLKADQSVWCWGRNEYGQLAIGSSPPFNGGIAGGAATTVQSWPAGSASSVAAGQDFTCISTPVGTVKCVGRGDSGQLGNSSSNNSTSVVSVTGISNATSVTAGESFACALLSDATVQCWGNNDMGQLGSGTNISSNSPLSVKGLVNVASVVAGDSFACAVLVTKNVKCWGRGIEGQIGNEGNLNTNVPISVLGLENVQSIALGYAHACALLIDSRVKCWGLNDQWQLGDGTSVNRNIPVLAWNYNQLSSISAGRRTTCIVLAGSGESKCWGQNNIGQLGNGSRLDSSFATKVVDLSNVAILGSADQTSCALLADNRLRCWGRGTTGQFDDGTFGTVRNVGYYYPIYRQDEYWSASPVIGRDFATLDSLVVVATAPDAPVAPVLGSRMKTWTSLSWTAPDNGGQVITNYRVRYSSNGGLTWTIVPDALLTRDSATSLSATVRGLTPATNYVFQVAAANAEGFGPWSASSVVGNTSTVPSAPTNVTVSAKTQSSVSLSWTAASDNGSAVTDYRIEFSDDGTNWTVFNDGVSANTSATVTGLARSGGYVFRVSAINANGAGLSGLALGIRAMSSGQAHHFCVVKSDKSLWCWGRNNYGQSGGGGYTSDAGSLLNPWPAGSVNAVATGTEFSCVLKVDSSISCWGRGDSGQLGNGASNNSTAGVAVSGISNASSIAAGQNFACAILADTTVSCWGNNDYGQLGNASNSASNTPVVVKGLLGATSITAGDLSVCVTLTNQSVKCWGRGTEGQLGNGGNLNSNVPVSVSSLDSARSISAGAYYFCALLNDMTVRCWGDNGVGQLGNGTTARTNTPTAVNNVANAVSLSSGNGTSCVLLVNGSVKCWGYNNAGQLGNGTINDSSNPAVVDGIANATSIAVGSMTTCVMLEDNKMRCWGRQSYGALDDGVVQYLQNGIIHQSDRIDGGNYGCRWWNGERSCLQDSWSTRPVIGRDFATLDALFVSRTVPGVPTNVRPISRSGTNVTISWSPPTEDGTRVITQYKIQISANYGGTWSDVNAENLSRTSLTATTAQISGLLANTSYGYRVAAVNAIGTGEWGSYTTPSAPRQLRIISQNADSVTVGWVSPEHSGGEIITGYEYSTNGGQTWAAIPGGSSVSAYKIPNLDATSPYQVKVRALSFLGVGESSTTLIVQLDPLPQAPVINSILAANGQVRLQISWSPLDTQENYTDRQYSINDGQDWQSFANSSEPYSISGLVNEQEYVIRVRAVNSAGAGAASESALAHPTRLVPVRPVIASVAAGDSSAIVRMAVPTDYSAQSVTGYQYSIDRGKTFQLAQVSDNSFSIHGLVNGKQTVIIVAAINFSGTSALSLPKTVIPASVPSAPNVSNGVAVLGSISVSVTTPDSGGRPISYFECSTDNGIVWKKCFNVKGLIKLTGLPNGVQHQLKVRAVNAMGPGIASETYEISTPMSVPGLPKVAWVAKNSNSITLDIVAPASDGGSGITGYAYSIDDRTWVVAGALVNGNQIVIGGLKSNKTYPVRIAAVNAIGRGLGTFRINITTLR